MNKNQKYIVIVSPQAQIELKTSKEFYESKQAGLGINFVNEIDTTIKRIMVGIDYDQGKLRKGEFWISLHADFIMQLD